MKKYRRVGGFLDTTDYLEVHDNGDVFRVDINGYRVMQDHHFARYILDGLEEDTLDWEEIP